MAGSSLIVYGPGWAMTPCMTSCPNGVMRANACRRPMLPADLGLISCAQQSTGPAMWLPIMQHPPTHPPLALVADTPRAVTAGLVVRRGQVRGMFKGPQPWPPGWQHNRANRDSTV